MIIATGIYAEFDLWQWRNFDKFSMDGVEVVGVYNGIQCRCCQENGHWKL